MSPRWKKRSWDTRRPAMSAARPPRRQARHDLGEPRDKVGVSEADARLDGAAELEAGHGEGAGEHEEEVAVVPRAHAVVDPRAVVVKDSDALLAPSAVLRAPPDGRLAQVAVVGSCGWWRMWLCWGVVGRPPAFPPRARALVRRVCDCSLVSEEEKESAGEGEEKSENEASRG
eukprot:scaffold60660_cov27-Tisochrysis_lutea.AAC.1